MIERPNMGQPQTIMVYALNFVVRQDRRDDPRILRFISVYRSPEVKAFIQERYGRYITPVW